MLGTCEALKSDASEIAAFASQPLCINYQVISENPTIYRLPRGVRPVAPAGVR